VLRFALRDVAPLIFYRGGYSELADG
jgi:hypothetical protein